MKRFKRLALMGVTTLAVLIGAVTFMPLRAIAGLETPCNFISDLVATNPLSSDLASTGDDHLRCIKSAVKGSFPNVNAAVNATDENLNALSATLTAAGILELEAASPRLIIDETDAASNERLYDFASSAGQLLGRTRTDADGAGSSWIVVDRTGTTVDSIALTATALTWGGNTLFTTANDGAGSGLDADLLDGSSSAAFAQLASSNSFSGTTQTLTNAEPTLFLTETGVAADSGSYRIRIAGTTFNLETRNDANTTGATVIQTTRTGTTVDTINLQATTVQINGNEVVRSSAGTYSPSATATLNLDSVTASTAQYMRVGNTVTVSGSITIDPTSASVDTTFRVTLPVSSNIAAVTECGGGGGQGYSTHGAVQIRGDATNDACEFLFNAGGTASTALNYSFTYLVQ